jgi:phosphate:Na+ symporter
VEQLQAMMKLCSKALEQMNGVMHGSRGDYDIHETYRIENRINQMRKDLKEENARSVEEKKYDHAAGSLYVDMISEMEKLGDFVVNVVQARYSH